jgi:hypothetical protein
MVANPFNPFLAKGSALDDECLRWVTSQLRGRRRSPAQNVETLAGVAISVGAVAPAIDGARQGVDSELPVVNGNIIGQD